MPYHLGTHVSRFARAVRSLIHVFSPRRTMRPHAPRLRAPHAALARLRHEQGVVLAGEEGGEEGAAPRMSAPRGTSAAEIACFTDDDARGGGSRVHSLALLERLPTTCLLPRLYMTSVSLAGFCVCTATKSVCVEAQKATPPGKCCRRRRRLRTWKRRRAAPPRCPSRAR